MKAVEAERLGGLLPSDYVTVQQLQSALQSAAVPGTPPNPKLLQPGRLDRRQRRVRLRNPPRILLTTMLVKSCW